jgi:hypothetical protein
MLLRLAVIKSSDPKQDPTHLRQIRVDAPHQAVRPARGGDL